MQQKPFTLSAEVIPPRNGAEQHRILDQIQQLIENQVQFLAVTKGAGGSLRGGSLPIAQLIKEKFQVPCIAHFTCRDLTPEEIENQLMDHHYFGVRNILALRGDPPNDYPNWQPKEGSYSYAHQLITQVKNLNSGQYLVRTGGRPTQTTVEKTDFCIGAAAYPEHIVPEERLEFFKQKVSAGAQYGITQMLFDPTVYARFVDLLQRNGINVPILPGTRVLRSKDQAERMASRFQVSVSKEYLNALPENANQEHLQQSVDLFLRFTEKLRSYGAPGVHLFVLSDTLGSCEVLHQLAKTFQSS